MSQDFYELLEIPDGDLLNSELTALQTERARVEKERRTETARRLR